MIYLLYGKDEYRVNQRLFEIANIYFEKIDLAQSDAKDVWNCLNQNSLFVSKKLLVIENAFLNANFKKDFSKKAQEFSNSESILIFVEKKEIRQEDPFFIILKKNGKVYEFPALVGKKLEEWARNLFIQFGTSITEKALQNLLLSTGNNLWTLSNEIKKLSVFKNNIAEKDIALLVRQNIKIEIFQTIDSLVSRNKKQALFALQRFIDSGENLFYLLSMMAYQMRSLLMVKIAQNKGNFLSNELGMKSFTLQKLTNMAKNISLEQLKKSLQNVFLADLKRKTGQESPEQAVRSLVLSI